MAITIGVPGPVQEEIATVARDVTYPAWSGVLLNRDDTLASRGRGAGLKIYDDIERDARVSSVLQKRKSALLAYPWRVVPASDAAEDVETAELVERQLKRMNFSAAVKGLGDAILKGYAVGEVMWSRAGDEIAAAEIRLRDQRRFRFDTDHNLRMLTRSDLFKGELLPERKFIVHSFGSKDGSPYGLGLGSKLFWPAYFKRQGITFWLTFADKFGSPTALGRYPASADRAAQDKLLDALGAIAQDAGVIIPEGMAIELLEAKRSGTMDGYESLCRYMDEQISEIVLGETLSTNIGSSGSRAASETHNEVRLELVRSDAEEMATTLSRSLIQWMVDFNRPGRAVPSLVWDVDQQEDLSVRSERDLRIAALGFEPTDQYISETYGPGWIKRPAPEPRSSAAQIPSPEALPAAFAEASREPSAMEEIVGALAQRLTQDAAEPMQRLLDQLREIVVNSADFAEIEARLLTVDLSLDDLVDAIERNVTLADLSGRAAIGKGRG